MFYSLLITIILYYSSEWQSTNNNNDNTRNIDASLQCERVCHLHASGASGAESCHCSTRRAILAQDRDLGRLEAEAMYRSPAGSMAHPSPPSGSGATYLTLMRHIIPSYQVIPSCVVLQT